MLQLTLFFALVFNLQAMASDSFEDWNKMLNDEKIREAVVAKVDKAITDIVEKKNGGVATTGAYDTLAALMSQRDPAYAQLGTEQANALTAIVCREVEQARFESDRFANQVGGEAELLAERRTSLLKSLEEKHSPNWENLALKIRSEVPSPLEKKADYPAFVAKWLAAFRGVEVAENIEKSLGIPKTFFYFSAKKPDGTRDFSIEEYENRFLRTRSLRGTLGEEGWKVTIHEVSQPPSATSPTTEPSRLLDDVIAEGNSIAPKRASLACEAGKRGYGPKAVVLFEHLPLHYDYSKWGNSKNLLTVGVRGADAPHDIRALKGEDILKMWGSSYAQKYHDGVLPSEIHRAHATPIGGDAHL